MMLQSGVDWRGGDSRGELIVYRRGLEGGGGRGGDEGKKNE
jgi:hypothetical protein